MESAKQIIESYSGRKLRVMEVCGTHTHEIFRLGIRRILPPQIELISEPGTRIRSPNVQMTAPCSSASITASSM